MFDVKELSDGIGVLILRLIKFKKDLVKMVFGICNVVVIIIDFMLFGIRCLSKIF